MLSAFLDESAHFVFQHIQSGSGPQTQQLGFIQSKHLSTSQVSVNNAIVLLTSHDSHITAQ